MNNAYIIAIGKSVRQQKWYEQIHYIGRVHSENQILFIDHEILSHKIHFGFKV